MIQTEEKHQILTQAIAALNAETALQLHETDQDFDTNNHTVDVVLEAGPNGPTLFAEIKRWANHTNIGALLHQIRQIEKPGRELLVAEYINPKMGEKLKEAGIQYLDTVGNAFINVPPIHINVKGNRPETTKTNTYEKTGRAFQTTGMKVIFALLTQPGLLNQPYRVIAEAAQVALGTIGGIMQDLTAHNLLFKEEGRRALTNRDELLDRWVEHYPYRLLKKQRIGHFTTNQTDWWRQIDPTTFDAQWGGEIAAAEVTHYLNPKDATLYIPKERAADLIKAARLRKVQPNETPIQTIELITPFWMPVGEGALVHPLIAYADLIASGNPRNLETAERLREQQIH